MTRARRLGLPAVIVAIAVAIALTTIVIGEAAAADTRERVRRAQIDLQTRLAQQIADGLVNEITSVYKSLLSGAPFFGSGTPLVEAVRRGDSSQMVQQLIAILPATPLSVTSVYLLASDGRIVHGFGVDAVGDAGQAVSGGRGSDPLTFNPSDRNTRVGTLRMSSTEFASTFATTRLFISSVYRPTGASREMATTSDRISIGVRILDPERRSPIAALVAEVGVNELFGGALLSLGVAADETYIVDGQGRLLRRLSRAISADPDAGRDLSGFEAIADALGGTSGADRLDPYTNVSSLMTTVATKPSDVRAAGVVDLGWRLVTLRSTATLYAQVDGGLQQFRLVRWVLGVLLVAAATALGVVLDQLAAQRRALRTANVELAVAAGRVERASRHKSEFLANMSHELRTPLNAVIGFSDVLIQQIAGTVNAKQSEYLEDIRASGRHLLALINDLLDLSKVEAGRMELQLGAFSLPVTLADGITMLRERANARRITLTLEVAPDVGLITADERKVKQVVANLLSNAVKFTPDGGSITLRASREEREVQVAVHDTGVGIALVDQTRIFEEFEQAKHGREAAEGTGLGLALTKKIIELHGGRIWVESEVGRGSTFTFALPLVPIGKAG